MPTVKSAYAKARHTPVRPSPDEPDDDIDSWKIDDPIAAYDAAMKSTASGPKPRKTKHQGGPERIRRDRECHLEPAGKLSVKEMQKDLGLRCAADDCESETDLKLVQPAKGPWVYSRPKALCAECRRKQKGRFRYVKAGTE